MGYIHVAILSTASLLLHSVPPVAAAAEDVPVTAAAATVVKPKYNLRLPETAKYYPHEVEDLIRQYHNAAADGDGNAKPVMKILAGMDAGEKYYDFDSFLSFASEDLSSGHLPLKLHDSPATTQQDVAQGDDGWTAWVKNSFGRTGKRQVSPASCPSGSSPCTNIQQPGFCCAGGTTCVNIADTGYGSVGCCPNGQACGGGLDSCAAGYYQCPQSAGGGCCAPGYLCSPQGCVINTSGITTPPVVTQVSTISVGLDICQTDYYPCPASLNFGCCRIGYLCGLTDCLFNLGTGVPGTQYATSGYNIPSTALVIVPSQTVISGAITTTEGFSVITRPSVNANSFSIPSTITGPLPWPKVTNAPGNILTVGSGNCPNGFSSCGAQHSGGCCRFGRDCGVSYCPLPTGSSLTGGGITTVTTNGACPGNWYQCPLSVSGGCCPSGYGCDVYNCPATTLQGGVPVVVTTAAAAQKVSPVGRPSGARSSIAMNWSISLLAGWTCLHMILLKLL